MLKKIAAKYQKILAVTQPFLLTFKGNLKQYDLKPFGLKIPKENILSCIDPHNALFYDLLQKLDSLSFGPKGMPMDKWVFFDCSEMPGGVFGFAYKAEDLSEEVLQLYGVNRSYKGLIPVSQYIAIPMAAPGAWFGHNLCTTNAVLGEKHALPGLSLLTKAFGLKVYNIKTLYGATQWDSDALNIHLQLSDMEIMSAYTPAHSFPFTMCYRSKYSDKSLLSALAGESRTAPKHDLLIQGKDEAAILNLQKRIEKGEKFKIPGRPVYKDKIIYVPLKKIK
ncbi:MAG: hypothetical protein WCG27_13605 [Pseudomonadota bacterium]